MIITILGFTLCAIIILYCGTKLAHYGYQIAELKGMSKAWFGLIRKPFILVWDKLLKINHVYF
jgi:hypothetical protein